MAHSCPDRPHVLVGVSGSVATIKLARLVRLLLEFADVRIVSTDAAHHFFADDDIPADVPCYFDSTEWRQWRRIGDGVLHIDV
jgi:phosphopantothenoylcysteine decarboxylase